MHKIITIVTVSLLAVVGCKKAEEAAEATKNAASEAAGKAVDAAGDAADAAGNAAEAAGDAAELQLATLSKKEALMQSMLLKTLLEMQKTRQ